MSRTFRIFVISTMLLISATAAAAEIEVSNAVIREAPPGMTVLAGYMTVVNHSKKAVDLTQAESEQFARIELHDHVMQDGMARMVQMPKVALKAGGQVVFQQGGKHLMMFEPARPLQQGDEVHVKLMFSDGTQRIVPFQVKKMTMPGGGHHHHGQ